MRRMMATLGLFALAAGPAVAQGVTQPIAPLPTAPACTCAAPAPVRTYHRATYRRRSAPANGYGVPGYSTSITPAPFWLSQQPLQPAPAPMIQGLAQFNTSGGWAGLGPNGTGLEFAGINDGIIGGSAGDGGPGPDNLGW